MIMVVVMLTIITCLNNLDRHEQWEGKGGHDEEDGDHGHEDHDANDDGIDASSNDGGGANNDSHHLPELLSPP